MNIAVFRQNPIPALLLLLTLSACISSKLIIKSDPTDSDVSISKMGAQEKIALGKTPVQVSVSELQEKIKLDANGGEFYDVTLEKKDFQTQHLLIPIPRSGHSETILLAKMVPGHEEGKVAQLLLQYLFNAQKLANQKEFERAQLELDKALAVDPSFTRALSLRGSIYFVQHNYAESLKWFSKALSIDPQFEDSIKMITQIKKITGEPLPANDQGPAQ